jgi:hypothetical protein
MRAGDKEAWAEYSLWHDSISLDDDGNPIVPPTVDFTDADLLWRLTMRGGLSKFHPMLDTLCTAWGYPIPGGEVSAREADLFSVDGGMLLAQMQASMAAGF